MFRLLLSEQEGRARLESDPQCGLTTGGQEECWWDCHRERKQFPESPGVFTSVITNPSCLSDCYPADHCLNSLLEDYKAVGGLCKGSYLDTALPGVFPTSLEPCEFFNPDDCDCTCTFEEIVSSQCQVDCCYKFETDIVVGLCSQRTKQLLRDQENCVHPLWSENFRLTIQNLVLSLCDYDTWFNFYPVPLGHKYRNRTHRNAKTPE